MKRTIVFAAVLATMSLFSACQKSELDVAPQQAGAERAEGYPGDSLSGESNCQPLSVNLYAGQTTLAGDVVAWNDASNLYVTYTTYDGWQLNETQVYAGPLSKLPATSKGNPKVGNFPYKATHAPGTTSFTYTIPLTDLGQDDCIAIATHAAVTLIGPDGQAVRSETAWGAGTRLTPRGNWATYFTYCICHENNNDGGGIEGN